MYQKGEVGLGVCEGITESGVREGGGKRSVGGETGHGSVTECPLEKE